MRTDDLNQLTPEPESQQRTHEPAPTSEATSGGGHVPALDGVRAVAVTLVLLFHLGVPGLRGGFVGVDVFFVLSGFLITSLLLGEMTRRGTVSLPGFWLRRARRLLPALVIVLLAVAASAALDPSFVERASLRGDLLSTTAYVANWHFISTSSYFSNIGVPSPLQHTWSLAIEEQFYFVWPVVIALVALVLRSARRRALAIGTVALVVAIASACALALLWTGANPERAYMGTDARIFEPLLGALGAVGLTTAVVQRTLRRRAAWFGVAGFVLLAGGVALVGAADASYHLGGAGLVAVAALLLVAPLWVSNEGPSARALSLRPVAWVGMISYGIYLWHWPILLWLHPDRSAGFEAVARSLLAVALTVGVAAASFYLVERPIRQGRRRAVPTGDAADASEPAPGPRRRIRAGLRRPGVVLATVPLVLVSVAGISLAATHVPPVDPNAPVVMFVGDSVPLHLGPAFETEAASRGWRLVSAAHGWCPVTGDGLWGIVSGKPVVYPQCRRIIGEQDALIRRDHPDVVVWWDRWDLNNFVAPDGTAVMRGSPGFLERRAETLDEGVRRLASHGAIVVLVAIEPVGMGIRDLCASGQCYPWNYFVLGHYRSVFEPWNDVLRNYARDHPEMARFVSFVDVVCHDDHVPCDDRIDGVPARSDGTHYSGDGETLASTTLADRIAPLLDHTGT